MKGIYIETPIGIVSGFNVGLGIVQATDYPEYIKYFKTVAAAQKFIDKYADIGYGLSSKAAKIISEHCKSCGWAGSESDLHCDRGGHNFVCPKCKEKI